MTKRHATPMMTMLPHTVKKCSAYEIISQYFECISPQCFVVNKVVSESVKRVEELSGAKVAFYKVDLLNEAALDHVFSQVPSYELSWLPAL